MARIIGNQLVIGTRSPRNPIERDTRTLVEQHDDAEKLHASDCRSGACRGCAS